MEMITDDNLADFQRKLEMIDAIDNMFRQYLRLKVNQTNSFNEFGLNSPEACIYLVL